jgi:hypothetical protein
MSEDYLDADEQNLTFPFEQIDVNFDDYVTTF